jgi:hypothetical protein
MKEEACLGAGNGLEDGKKKEFENRQTLRDLIRHRLNSLLREAGEIRYGKKGSLGKNQEELDREKKSLIYMLGEGYMPTGHNHSKEDVVLANKIIRELEKSEWTAENYQNIIRQLLEIVEPASFEKIMKSLNRGEFICNVMNGNAVVGERPNFTKKDIEEAWEKFGICLEELMSRSTELSLDDQEIIQEVWKIFKRQGRWMSDNLKKNIYELKQIVGRKNAVG